MRIGYEIILVCLLSSALLLMTGCGEDPSSGTPVATKASPPTIPPGYSSKSIHVKFQEGTNVERPLEGLPPGLRDAVVSHTKLFSLPEQKLNELRARERSRLGTPLPDLNLWVEMTLQSGTDAAAFLAEMKHVPNVEIATSAPLPQPPPWIPPDFTRKQGYLDPAPGGIEARFSWTIPGGNGNGVTIYNVEYNWLQTHDDLSRAGAVILLLNLGDSNNPLGFEELGCPAPCDRINREHGTAVLGAMVADYDTRGVTGISWGAHIGLAPANTLNLGYNPANAIILAVANGSAGDVILLEQQYPVCGLPNFGPIEVLPSVFDAIQTAVAQGFVVVEAAGNGGVNLDQAPALAYSTGPCRIPEPSSWAQGNNQAVEWTANAKSFPASGVALICRGGDLVLSRQDTVIYIWLQIALPILTFGIQGGLTVRLAPRRSSPVRLQTSKALR